MPSVALIIAVLYCGLVGLGSYLAILTADPVQLQQYLKLHTEIAVVTNLTLITAVTVIAATSLAKRAKWFKTWSIKPEKST